MTAMSKKREDTTIYQVVVNSESRYSIWPQDRELPPGWVQAGKSGLHWECVDFIGDVWIDQPAASPSDQDAAGHAGQPASAGKGS